MPRGEYAILDDAGARAAIETFTSAPGPMGWRYYATVQRFDGGGTVRLDVSVDAGGRPVRVRLENDRHELLIAIRDGELRALRDGEALAFDADALTGVSYPSPGFEAVAVHALDGSAEPEVLRIEPGTLEVGRMRRRITIAGEGSIATHAGAFDARHFMVDGQSLWVAGTVAVAGEGWFELTAYEAGASGPAPRLRSV
jgi:hypothetical protein